MFVAKVRKVGNSLAVILTRHTIETLGISAGDEMTIDLSQISPQVRILVAIESIDGRKGLDALAQLCREKLDADPFSDICLYSGPGAEQPSDFCSLTAKGTG